MRFEHWAWTLDASQAVKMAAYVDSTATNATACPSTYRYRRS
jgi:hypothetical protein